MTATQVPRAGVARVVPPPVERVDVLDEVADDVAGSLLGTGSSPLPWHGLSKPPPGRSSRSRRSREAGDRDGVVAAAGEGAERRQEDLDDPRVAARGSGTGSSCSARCSVVGLSVPRIRWLSRPAPGCGPPVWMATHSRAAPWPTGCAGPGQACPVFACSRPQPVASSSLSLLRPGRSPATGSGCRRRRAARRSGR